MDNEKIIEVSGLTKVFKELTAVNNLTLNVYKGDVFGFLGPNGAGKSTTIRMLLSLIRPTSGAIKIFGLPLLTHRDDILRRIGAIVEKPDFYGYLSAYRNLEILGSISGCDTSKKRIMEILELVGLEKRYKSKVKTYSHGMKQRLGIAQALLHNPDLIILDEPTTGLDPQGMKEIRDLIIHLSRDQKKTIFLSSHILYEVELVANRMVILNKGTTVIEGAVQDLLDATHLNVTFEVDDVVKAENILKNHFPSIPVDSITTGKILLRSGREDISLINRAFIESGLAVSEISPKKSLEEYFLKLTEVSEK
ncbi:MAG: ABC transporter ATP-binding protein [Ignavibacteriaceae bacterium]|nr:ABC transporter ATP-binding protein [Ignavibacteriaceae bacterium]